MGGVDLMGYAAHYAYIDSVQDMDCYGSGWDWDNRDCPFDNDLTMGMLVEETMYGVIGEPSLNNVFIYKHKITNRNPDPIENIFLGSFDDYDLEANASDYWYFDAAANVSWGGSSNAPDWAHTKIYGKGVVGCETGMIGVRTLDAQQALWHNANIGLDSMYYWCQQPGATYQAGIVFGSESDDRDAWMSLVGHDFAGDEVWTTGHFFFGFGDADLNDAAKYTDLAALVNDLCGFNRGDINGDGAVNLADAVALWLMVNMGGPGPVFDHSADVNCDGVQDNADVLYLLNYHFCAGPAPCCEWALPEICP
jgi:hypothetical protein